MYTRRWTGVRSQTAAGRRERSMHAALSSGEGTSVASVVFACELTRGGAQGARGRSDQSLLLARRGFPRVMVVRGRCLLHHDHDVSAAYDALPPAGPCCFL
jgi:hypothetical protein